LTEELVRLGHDVTLFASADSITSAELAPYCTRALRLDPTVRDTIPHFMLMIDKVRERAKEFDVFAPGPRDQNVGRRRHPAENRRQGRKVDED
jgi:hypothetical protein